jgi:hypothetical protein
MCWDLASVLQLAPCSRLPSMSITLSQPWVFTLPHHYAVRRRRRHGHGPRHGPRPPPTWSPPPKRAPLHALLQQSALFITSVRGRVSSANTSLLWTSLSVPKRGAVASMTAGHDAPPATSTSVVVSPLASSATRVSLLVRPEGAAAPSPPLPLGVHSNGLGVSVILRTSSNVPLRGAALSVTATPGAPPTILTSVTISHTRFSSSPPSSVPPFGIE